MLLAILLGWNMWQWIILLQKVRRSAGMTVAMTGIFLIFSPEQHLRGTAPDTILSHFSNAKPVGMEGPRGAFASHGSLCSGAMK